MVNEGYPFWKKAPDWHCIQLLYLGVPAALRGCRQGVKFITLWMKALKSNFVVENNEVQYAQDRSIVTPMLFRIYSQMVTD